MSVFGEHIAFGPHRTLSTPHITGDHGQLMQLGGAEMTGQDMGPDDPDKTDNTYKTRPALNDWGIPDWRNEET